MKKLGKKWEWLEYTGVIFLSFLICFIITLLVVKDWERLWSSYRIFLTAPLKKWRLFSGVLEEMIPLLFCGLASCVMLQAGQISLIGHSSFHFGSMIAAYVAIHSGLPFGWNQLVTLLVGGGVGGLIAGIPGLMKAKLKINETVTSVLLNQVIYYVAVLFMLYILRTTETGALASPRYPNTTNWPEIFGENSRLYWGIVVLISLLIIILIFLYKTKWGYAFRMVGKSRKFALYSGISIGMVILFSHVIGGGIYGMGGVFEATSGLYARYIWEIPPSYAMEGFFLAALSRGKLKFLPISAFIVAWLKVGLTARPRMMSIPVEIISIFYSVAVMLISAQTLFPKIRHKIVAKKALQKFALNDSDKL